MFKKKKEFEGCNETQTTPYKNETQNGMRRNKKDTIRCKKKKNIIKDTGDTKHIIILLTDQTHQNFSLIATDARVVLVLNAGVHLLMILCSGAVTDPLDGAPLGL